MPTLSPLARRRRREEGSALLEALIALTILSMALLFVLPLFALEAEIGARAVAHREVIAYLEGVIEGVRAGIVPMVTGEVDPDLVVITPPSTPGLTVWMDVEPDTAADGLWSVRVEAQYMLRGTARRQRLSTLVWRPDD